jgi:hypothetical protein
MTASERIFRYALRPRFRAKAVVESGEPESVCLGQGHEVGIGHVPMAGDRRDAVGVQVIGDESATPARLRESLDSQDLD